MKTVELKWIEDDNHTVAKDACDTLQGLIDGGAFPDLTVKCEDDTLYITGEKEVLDRAVMKIQKAFAKYGQIMMKEAKNGTTEELRIESFDDNVQDIFNHTLAEYETFKENTKEERPNTYITTLGKFQYKFNKLKEAASKKDKKILQNILMEIDELTESYEEVKFKPENTVNEDSLDDIIDRTGHDTERIATKGFSGIGQNADYYNNYCFTFKIKDWRNWDKYGLPDYPVFFPRDPENIDNKYVIHTYLNFKQTLKMFDKVPGKIMLVEPRFRDGCMSSSVDGDYVSKDAWIAFAKNFLGIEPPQPKQRKPRDPNKGYKKPDYINPDMKGGTYFDGDTQVYEMPEENESFNGEKKRNLSKETFGKKFLELAQTYAGVEGLDIEVAYDKLMSDNRVFELVDSTMSIEDIMDKISAGELLQ